MESVNSADGTRIAFYRQGKGRPLVLIHGTGGTNPVLGWSGVVPALEERFTVYAIDRRGRGESGDSPSYAIEREFEDVAAVIEAIGEPADVLGHSFGALCALEAALVTKNIRKLILYEPSFNLAGVSEDLYEFVESFEAFLAAGDREALYTFFLHEEVGVSSEQIVQMRSSAAWTARLASAHTLPREYRAEEQYEFDARRFEELRIPTLLLVGSDSRREYRELTEIVDAALPNSRLRVMPGQAHMAMYTAPELFRQEVIAFLA
jgi:pimeloyl-ACP methyl ester carboxylesterase